MEETVKETLRLSQQLGVMKEKSIIIDFLLEKLKENPSKEVIIFIKDLLEKLR